MASVFSVCSPRGERDFFPGNGKIAAMNEPATEGKRLPDEAVAMAAEHLFRHESAKLIAALTRIFGVQHLSLVEDVLQDALARALRIWPSAGIPENPPAWLMQVAKNLAMDVVRREKSFRDKESAIIATIDAGPFGSPEGDVRFEEELADDRLRLLFVCCHPVLPQDAQVALALKTLCGFSTIEIARAFLTNEPAIAKRLTRAKQKLRDSGVPFEIPSGAELEPRFEAVLQTIYLLFNEGYKASSGEALVREELCQEAIRLLSLLVEHRAGDRPNAHALLALMLFNAARFKARTDAEGNVLTLGQQDRSAWDQRMIRRGMIHLGCSARGAELTEYHLQAGIAAAHCAAPDGASTDWSQILRLYDQLSQIDHSPIVALNRSVAVAHVHGAAAGLAALDAIKDRERLQGYHLFHAVRGEFHARLEQFTPATECFRSALALAETTSERSFLRKRLAESETAGTR